MPDVVIVGAGIGGLASALSLHAVGVRDVVILEAAAELEPLGVGLNILPNAVRELAALNVLDELSQQAVHTDELVLRTRRGGLVWREPRGTAAGYWWPQLSIHRAVLQHTLVAAVRRRLGAQSILLDSRVTTIADGRAAVKVTFERSSGVSGSRLTSDIVIGADGIHSTVRHTLYPEEGLPKWNGWVMWRGVSTAEPYLSGKAMVVAGDTQSRIVTYPISRPAPGGLVVNWVVAGPADESPARYGDWNHVSQHDRALRRCANWSFDDWLDVPGLIRSTNRVLEYPMVDRDPLPTWTKGRISLVGDAAHPMYPAGSNGATQAIVDARSLAHRLATAHESKQGLRAYDQERRRALAAIQLNNREMGPEAVIDRAHTRAPNGFTNIERVIPRHELARVSRDYAKIGGFDQATVNQPSPHNARAHDPNGAAAEQGGQREHHGQFARGFDRV